MRIYQSSRNLLRLGYILYTKGTKMISFTKFKFGKYFIIFQTLFQLVVCSPSERIGLEFLGFLGGVLSGERIQYGDV